MTSGNAGLLHVRGRFGEPHTGGPPHPLTFSQVRYGPAMTADYRPSLVRSFERHLRAENRSEHTIASYLESLRQAEAFLAARLNAQVEPAPPPPAGALDQPFEPLGRRGAVRLRSVVKAPAALTQRVQVLGPEGTENNVVAFQSQHRFDTTLPRLSPEACQRGRWTEEERQVIVEHRW
jgi:hypothetical protein